MATRYCGRVKITCTLVSAPHMPHGEQYKCSLSVGGKKQATEYVGLPQHLTHAIDSPQMVDSTAHAALSFASHDGKIDDADCDFTDSGYHIRRALARKSYARAKRSYRRR